MTLWLRRLVFGILALLAGAASGHELSMAEMELRETSRGEFSWMWSASGARPASQELTPVWPDGCRADASVLRCGAGGLQGRLSVDGVGQRYSAALVKVFWQGGQTRVYTLTAGQPTVQLYGAADDARGRFDIAWAYAVLGVEHVLGGYDHLLFVIGLLFLVGFNRRLILTVTAFTAAHSLTLASSALGLLTLRPPPVEAAIALSVMLVAAEALLFGLVHGLGFAGALKDIGLPENHLWIALLTFNVGVEVGQLLTIAAAGLLYRAVRHWPVLSKARLATLYAIGTVAAYWSFARIVTLVG